MRPSRFPVLWFLALAYVVSGVGAWGNLAAMRDRQAPPPWVPYALGAGPSLAGLLMTLCLYGLPGAWRLARQLAPGWLAWRAWPVLVACLLLPLGAIVVPIAILAAAGAPVSPPSWSVGKYLFGAAAGGFLGPGLFEEVGWRGFALPHLQRRYSALVSSLLIGLAWALWHWPNFVLPSEPPPWWHLPAYVVLIVAVSVVFTWAYNSTGGSLFAVVLLHGAIYAALGLCPSPDAETAAREDLTFGLVFAVIAGGLAWRYGAANLSWRNRVVSQPPSQAPHLPPAATQVSGSS